MKKKLMLGVLPLLMAFNISMPVMAADMTSATDEATTQISIEYPEGFVPDNEKYKTKEDQIEEAMDEASERTSTQEGELWGGYSSYQEYLEATSVTELTEEQAAAGYSINEYGQLVDPEDNDPYCEVIMDGVQPGKNTGYVKIEMTTDSDIHEEVYVYVMHMGSYKIYGCHLYEINEYSSQLCLPAGEYILEQAGLTLDGKGRFYSDVKQFTVERAGTTILKFELKDKDMLVKDMATSDSSGIEEDASAGVDASIDNAIPEKQVITDKAPERKVSISSIIFFIIFIGIIIYGVYRFAPRNKKNTRGFDD